MDRVKETAMTLTRRMRLWITAVLTMAATALTVGLAVTAQAGVHQAHPNPPLAGITFNALATDGGSDVVDDKEAILLDTDDPAAFDGLLSR
jgi:hypothetical protein